MHKVVVVTDSDTADGFRLAGVEVAVAGSCEEAGGMLVALIADESVGIVAVNENLLPPIGDRARADIDALLRPIVVSLPIGTKLTQTEDRRAYLERLISKLVGFDISGRN